MLAARAIQEHRMERTVGLFIHQGPLAPVDRFECFNQWRCVLAQFVECLNVAFDCAQSRSGSG